ncbi:MAG: metallophosphoesterase family protein [Clostridia bacterium]|nr:metallophosphoesterase family protein [Clostridia bacterium]
MKIAIISDIHGNLEALKCVLRDVNACQVDKLICLGDTIGKGVNASTCIDLVRANCDVVLYGNTDTRFCENPKDWENDPIEFNRIKFNQSLISNEQMEYLKSLPFAEEFYLSGYLVRLFHAHPTSCFKFVNEYDKSFHEKFKMFQGSDLTPTKATADIVVYGHLHYPFMQKLFNRTLICSGSVGNSVCTTLIDGYNSDPSEIIQAHYVILEGEYGSKTPSKFDIQFKSVPYDIEKELQSNVGVNPEYDAYKIELQQGRYRNMERVNQSFIEQGYDI